MLLIDEFEGEIPFAALKRICDPWYDADAPIKGDHVKLRHNVIFIASNKHPNQWWTKNSPGDHFRELDRRVEKWIFFPSNEEPEPINGVGGYPFKWIKPNEFEWPTCGKKCWDGVGGYACDIEANGDEN